MRDTDDGRTRCNAHDNPVVANQNSPADADPDRNVERDSSTDSISDEYPDNAGNGDRYGNFAAELDLDRSRSACRGATTRSCGHGTRD